MSRIVFFSIPAYGHTNPTVEVVRQLVRRGHRVRYYSFEEFRAKLEGAGAEFVPCDTFLPPAPRDLGRRMGHDFSSLMAMVIDVTVAMEEKVLRELGEFRPDCVVADSICGASCTPGGWGCRWCAPPPPSPLTRRPPGRCAPARWRYSTP